MKTTADLNKGDRVTIYQDPISRRKPEGYAILKKLRAADPEGQRWTVWFPTDDALVDRLIVPPFEVLDPIFGWEITCRMNNGDRARTFHFRGSLTACRRRAVLKRHVVEIIGVEPVTEAEWLRAYGIGRM